MIPATSPNLGSLPGQRTRSAPLGPPQDHSAVLEVRDAHGGHYLPHGEPLAPAAERVGEHDSLDEARLVLLSVTKGPCDF